MFLHGNPPENRNKDELPQESAQFRWGIVADNFGFGSGELSISGQF
jgi:hypothetical protein